MARGGPLKTSWQRMALDTSTRAISSRTMAASMSPMPMPPNSSATVTVKRSARRRASREASANSSVSSHPAAWGAMSRSATSRASFRRADLSSLSTVPARSDAVTAVSPMCSYWVHESVPARLWRPVVGPDTIVSELTTL